MTKINAQIVADSINQQGDRITSMLVTFPRFILAELNTHRMLSKNSASSRAIPFKKMVESVMNDPFIPIAWQKEHKGMQGTEYFTDVDDIKEKEMYWLTAKSSAINMAQKLNNHDTTKQLCNRLLEPFMWHTVLITGTEWKNFFDLRCPQYLVDFGRLDQHYRKSRKDVIDDYVNMCGEEYRIEERKRQESRTELDWLKLNKGQAEIHMMTLAEAMWDAMRESTPKELKAGEWHIPFEDKIESLITNQHLERFNDNSTISGYINSFNIKDKVKISTSMSARTSYTVVGDEKEFTYEQQIALHDRMANAVPFHASPFEHCARAMTEQEYTSAHSTGLSRKGLKGKDAYGWCRNFKGFIQYREILEMQK